MGATHVILDILGLIPGFGEPFDAINVALYLIEDPPDWFAAALTALALIPVLGIGFTVVKNLIKAGKKTQATALIKKSVVASGLSKEQVVSVAVKKVDELVDKLNAATKRLEENMGVELKNALPDDATIKTKIIDQVNALIKSIKFASDAPGARDLAGSGARKAYTREAGEEMAEAWVKNLDDLAEAWGKLSAEQIQAYRRLALAAAETASARLARKIGGLAGDRIKVIDNTLSTEQVSAISREIFDHITTKMNIRIIFRLMFLLSRI